MGCTWCLDFAGSWWDIIGVFFFPVSALLGLADFLLSAFLVLFIFLCPLSGWRVGLDTVFLEYWDRHFLLFCVVFGLFLDFQSRGFPLHCLLVAKWVLNASFM